MNIVALIKSLGLEMLIPVDLPSMPAIKPIGFGGIPRGDYPIRPYSRSKYRPHNETANSSAAARRRRQILRGTVQVSEQHVPVQHPESRQVKPHRSGGATRMWTDDYDMAY